MDYVFEHACYNNYLDKVIDMCYEKKYNKEGLFLACRQGHSEVIKFILEETKINLTIEDKIDCACLLAEQGHLDMLIYVQYFMFPLKTDDEMVLLSAIFGNQMEVILYLIDVVFCNIQVLIPLLKNSKINLSPEVKSFLDEQFKMY
jgi:hypothetical protein